MEPEKELEAPPTRIRVMAIDDQIPFLKYVELSVKGDSRITFVGGFQSPIAGVEYLNESGVDVALVDFNMPEMDGLSCTRAIKAKKPGSSLFSVAGIGDKLEIRNDSRESI